MESPVFATGIPTIGDHRKEVPADYPSGTWVQRELTFTPDVAGIVHIEMWILMYAAGAGGHEVIFDSCTMEQA
jgi:hypothetical protein